MKRLRIQFCASEMAPFAKTGGLADVLGALPVALAKQGVSVVCVIPHYGRGMHDSSGFAPAGKPLEVKVGSRSVTFRVYRRRYKGIPVYALSAPELFDRPFLYGDQNGDYKDNGLRFAAFCRACLDLGRRFRDKPTVYHIHDWQTSLIAVYLHRDQRRDVRSVLTIHNLAYHGTLPPEQLEELGLDRSYFHWQRLEFYGRINLLKGGIVFADALTTVSPTYAKEIQTPESGCGLDGVLREKADRLVGILNGIDDKVWDPARDPHLPARYSVRDLERTAPGAKWGKTVCREALIEKAGLEHTEKPLFGVISRLVEQKGIPILLPALEALLAEGCLCVVLGTGAPEYEEALRKLNAAYPKRLGLFLTFDVALSHLIEAGSDMFLMPSRFEPCGLNQFYSMRYGTVPVVRATGGLADSVVPFTPEGLESGRSTGFVFGPYSPEALLEALRQATAVFADKPRWKKLMLNGMKQDFSWNRSAERYLGLYKSLVGPEA